MLQFFYYIYLSKSKIYQQLVIEGIQLGIQDFTKLYNSQRRLFSMFTFFHLPLDLNSQPLPSHLHTQMHTYTIYIYPIYVPIVSYPYVRSKRIRLLVQSKCLHSQTGQGTSAICKCKCSEIKII